MANTTDVLAATYAIDAPQIVGLRAEMKVKLEELLHVEVEDVVTVRPSEGKQMLPPARSLWLLCACRSSLHKCWCHKRAWHTLGSSWAQSLTAEPRLASLSGAPSRSMCVGMYTLMC